MSKHTNMHSGHDHMTKKSDAAGSKTLLGMEQVSYDGKVRTGHSTSETTGGLKKVTDGNPNS